jgi:hypothetical protein
MADKSEERNGKSPEQGPLLEEYSQFGGQQAEAAALRNVLAHLGGVAAHSGAAMSEAMLFGIGGGIGAAYFKFEYESAGVKTLFLGTRINTQENKSPEFLHSICERIGVAAQVLNSGSASAAEKKLVKSLDEGIPAIIWVDPSRRPYLPLTELQSHYHTVVAFGLDTERDEAHIADLSTKVLTISRSELASVRKIEGAGSMSFRALKVEAPTKALDLREGVREGIIACYQQMLHGWDKGGFRGNFGVQGLRKWADLLTDPKDKKGWPNFFPRGADLVSALWSLFGQIETRGNGSGAFRPLYAEFLDEAGDVLGVAKLSEVADKMRASGRMWSQVAAALLPESIEPFSEMRRLGRERQQLFVNKGQQGLDEIRTINNRLEELQTALGAEFPLDPGSTADLLNDLQVRVQDIAQMEEAAMMDLQTAID